MIEIDEGKFGFNEMRWLLTDEGISSEFLILEQLYAQMMGWA